MKIDDRAAVHMIPRAEVRYVEVAPIGGDDWELKYQLTGAAAARSIEWRGDCRPPTLKNDKISIGEYNRIAAGSIQTMITCGHRDVHLERRSDGVILVRSGLVEEDDRVVLCRKFIAEAALVALATPHGRLDPAHGALLREIFAAARDLVLPDTYPIQEEPR